MIADGVSTRIAREVQRMYGSSTRRTSRAALARANIAELLRVTACLRLLLIEVPRPNPLLLRGASLLLERRAIALDLVARPAPCRAAGLSLKENSMRDVSDEALATLRRIVDTLHPSDRSQFMRDVAVELRKHETIGDGLVSRIAAEVHARYFRAPDVPRESSAK